MKIGFIGQGFIGKNYADDFEHRGFEIVRFAKEEPFIANKDKIKECEIVFVAVPTPTTKKGFDYSIVESVLADIKKGTIVVIKSTLLPGTTNLLQKKYKNLFICHSPEFLVEKTAPANAASPERNIVGVVSLNKESIKKAKKVLEVLPRAPYEKIMTAKEAEMVKYVGNCFLYTKVVFFNLMFDLIQAERLSYETIVDAVVKDPRIGVSHTKIVDNSGHTKKAGRGAGGHCFIKDFNALLDLYKNHFGVRSRGFKALSSLEEKNIELLIQSNKDLDLLVGVKGSVSKYKK